MKLKSTDKIEVFLSGSVTANQLQLSSSWDDVEMTNKGVSDSDCKVIPTNNTTVVEIVSAP